MVFSPSCTKSFIPFGLESIICPEMLRPDSWNKNGMEILGETSLLPVYRYL